MPESTITAARITAMPRPMPKGMFDPMPEVWVTIDGQEQKLFDYYPDELSFTEREFLGKTLAEGRRLKFLKDRAYLQS
jgi:hypothetical protein